MTKLSKIFTTLRGYFVFRSRKQRKIVKYQDPMPLDVVEEKMQLERRLNKIKAIKEKQDLILQRRK